MEAVDRNTEYEQQATGGEFQAIGRQVSDYENEYDSMYRWAWEQDYNYDQNEKVKEAPIPDTIMPI